jgi:lysophospholipase L1-like esterase
VLALVAPKELGGGTSSDADHVRAAVTRHPKRSLLLDWVSFSAGHGSWFQPDGLHLTYAGARAFARLFKKALPFAQPSPPPHAP